MIGFGTILWGAAATYSAVRAAWRPHRAVTEKGAVAACEGRNRYGVCDPSIRIAAARGSDVLGTAPGRVVAMGPTFVHVAAANEPVILMYDGIEPLVKQGAKVSSGQTIGRSRGEVAFGVWRVGAEGRLTPLPPSAWLASRGFNVIAGGAPGTKWCEGGRDISVPETAGRTCRFKQPEPGRFALLPVRVSIAT